jgi:hypothetical protein
MKYRTFSKPYKFFIIQDNDFAMTDDWIGCRPNKPYKAQNKIEALHNYIEKAFGLEDLRPLTYLSPLEVKAKLFSYQREHMYDETWDYFYQLNSDSPLIFRIKELYEAL